jgi:hypothetical protein
MTLSTYPCFTGLYIDAVEMMLQIVAVCDRMFPIPALPEATFAFGDPRCASAFTPGNATRECLYERMPA